MEHGKCRPRARPAEHPYPLAADPANAGVKSGRAARDLPPRTGPSADNELDASEMGSMLLAVGPFGAPPKHGQLECPCAALNCTRERAERESLTQTKQSDKLLTMSSSA